MRTPPTVVAAVAVLVAVGASALTEQDPDSLAPTQEPPTTMPIRAQTLACPESPTTGRQVGTVYAVTPRLESTGPEEQRLALSPLEDDEGGELDLTDRIGTVVADTESGPRTSTAVTSQGASAAAVAAVQYVESQGDQRTGLESVRCSAASNQWWFSGIDTSPRATTELVLVNPTPAVSVVSVRFFGPRGEVAAPAARGIPVGPRTSQFLDLAGFAPGIEAGTVLVEATRGQIAPAVHSRRFAATTPLGSDWLPASVAPSRDLLVDPTVPGRGGRTLVVTNPGSGAALVQGRVLDDEGAFNPPELADLAVPPGGTVEVELDDVVESSSAAVRLTGNVPIVAGVITQTAAAGRGDLAYSRAGTAFEGPAALPVPAGTDVSLELTTLRAGGGRAEVRWFDRSGAELGRESLRVVGSATTSWQPSARRSDEIAYVVVTPDRASELQGVLVVSGDAGVTSLPLTTETLTASQPAVEPAGP